ncbi:tellurite resistance TerB family protein [Limibacillus sp. MBR-115]|jgi:tellurite resistance protein|uniref:tellurite resistance TerB family protein n=1 Tax=Limibacillus sp. MBR-115 TaxID=3156465 RepID=UPI003393EC4C
MIGHHEALIYTMVMMSAADNDMTDKELSTIADIVRHLPVFDDFKVDDLPALANRCSDLLADEDGLDKALEMIASALPAQLRETAYAVACDVAAADGLASQEELRLLEMLRFTLPVGRLPAAAIERGARARYTRMT